MNPLRKAAGMTSLEVLCATVLASLLMTAVLGVIAGLSRHEKTIDRRAAQPPWARRLADQLRRDFLIAERITPAEDGILLQGPYGRDPTTGAATWRPGIVEYRLLDTKHAGQVLMRIERPEPPLSTNLQSEAACFGVERMALLQSPEEIGFAETGPPDLPAFVTDLDAGPTPQRLQFLLWRPGQQSPALECRFVRP